MSIFRRVPYCTVYKEEPDDVNEERECEEDYDVELLFLIG